MFLSKQQIIEWPIWTTFYDKHQTRTLFTFPGMYLQQIIEIHHLSPAPANRDCFCILWYWVCDESDVRISTETKNPNSTYKLQRSLRFRGESPNIYHLHLIFEHCLSLSFSNFCGVWGPLSSTLNISMW